MFKDITDIDRRIMSLFSRDFKAEYSILQVTKLLKINYSHAFKRVACLAKMGIIRKEKAGSSNFLSLNLKNIDTIKLISSVEEQVDLDPGLGQVVKAIIELDPFASIGIFGSRASETVDKSSDWDIFILSSKRLKNIESFFPHLENFHFLVFSLREFFESMRDFEDNVVKHILRNKLIIYNPHPFYNLIYGLERTGCTISGTD